MKKTCLLFLLLLCLLLPGLIQAKFRKCLDSVCRRNICFRDETRWGLCLRDLSKVNCCLWVKFSDPEIEERANKVRGSKFKYF